MNLTKLFDTQRILDERIIKEKGLEGQDLLPEKILALQVELGELANEWRGFKFWSFNKRPRTKRQVQTCDSCTGLGTVIAGRVNGVPLHVNCSECNGEGGKFKNPLLGEYIDCLHFILSIGLEIGYLESFSLKVVYPAHGSASKTFFIELFNDCFKFANLISEDDYYNELVQCFMDLGYLLGFTWEQIETAYYEKNRINHDRQENGY